MRVARAQHGVFTTAQAARVGVTRDLIASRVRRGILEPLHLGVYRVAGHPRTWHGEVLAACLAWGPGAVASHSCAAALWGITGFGRGGVVLTVPRHRKRELPTHVHRWSRPDPKHVTRIGPIPITTVERTLLDIAGALAAGPVEEALDDALRRGMTTPTRLHELLFAAARQRRAGVALLRELLQARSSLGLVSESPESVFERRLSRVLRAAGLPDPVSQFPVEQGGRTVARIDLAYPDQKLAIEPMDTVGTRVVRRSNATRGDRPC